MERTFISWNITNWITVMTMVFLGWSVFAMLSQLWKNWGRATAAIFIFAAPALAPWALGGGMGYA